MSKLPHKCFHCFAFLFSTAFPRLLIKFEPLPAVFQAQISLAILDEKVIIKMLFSLILCPLLCR